MFVCVCVCPNVCSPACLSAVVAERLSEDHHQPPPTHPPRASTPLPSSPSAHTATETLPEIFNSVAAVNSTATLESMSGRERAKKENGHRGRRGKTGR